MTTLTEEMGQLRAYLRNRDREPIHKLRESLNLQTPTDEFRSVQTLVSRISNQFVKFGWPPLRVQASYFSQGGAKSDFEISWLRNDLLIYPGGNSRTTTSHGPAFRFVIGNPNSALAQMSNRHSVEARTNFIKNVLSPTSSRWIEHSLTELGKNGVVVKWTDEWYRIVNMEDLRDLASFVSKSKGIDSMKYSCFYASKQLKPTHLEDEQGLPLVIVKFFAKTAPLFWGHHMVLEPKAARTQRQTRHQISREQLRKDILKIESRCQNADCSLNGGDSRMLKVAHLTPKINILSNVIVLCPLCYDAQFPATSVIRVRSELQSIESDRRQYSVEIETRDGPKMWRISSSSDHPLSNPRV